MSRLDFLPLSAAVLTGGQSRRMGTDKALLVIDGSTLLERALKAVRAVGDDVLIVGARAAYQGFGAPVIEDDYPGQGPLGGIATALRAAKHSHVLVVACDMPFLNPDVLRAMASEPRDVDVLVPHVSSRRDKPDYQPLHAIYGLRCLPAIEQALAAGRRSVMDIYADLNVRTYDELWIRAHDPGLDSFLNVNAVEDLERARRRQAEEREVE